MTAGGIDFTALEKAVAALTEAVEARAAAPDDAFIRDASIQRFEFTYEVAHKMVRRHLAATEPSADAVRALSFPDLMRLAWQRGLLASDWRTWQTFRTARNATSHAYDAAKAEEVAAIIPAFLGEARHLLAKLTGQ